MSNNLRNLGDFEDENWHQSSNQGYLYLDHDLSNQTFKKSLYIQLNDEKNQFEKFCIFFNLKTDENVFILQQDQLINLFLHKLE